MISIHTLFGNWLSKMDLFFKLKNFRKTLYLQKHHYFLLISGKFLIFFIFDPSDVFFFFNVGPPKEDIFSGHLLSPIFQSSIYMLHYRFLALEAAQVYVCSLYEAHSYES